MERKSKRRHAARSNREVTSSTQPTSPLEAQLRDAHLEIDRLNCRLLQINAISSESRQHSLGGFARPSIESSRLESRYTTAPARTSAAGTSSMGEQLLLGFHNDESTSSSSKARGKHTTPGSLLDTDFSYTSPIVSPKKTARKDNTPARGEARGQGVDPPASSLGSVTETARPGGSFKTSTTEDDLQDESDADSTLISFGDGPKPVAKAKIPIAETWIPVGSADKAELDPTATFNTKVSRAEHRRLAGAVHYIEEMDEVEKAKHWGRLESESPIHRPAKEWEHYYRFNILPKFLKSRGSLKESNESDVENLENSGKSTNPTNIARGSASTAEILQQRGGDNNQSFRHVDKRADLIASADSVSGAYTPSDANYTASSSSENRLPRNSTRALAPNPCYRMYSDESQQPSKVQTVLLTNLPTTVKLTEVVDCVRGGAIRSATLIATNGLATIPRIKGHSIMIIFLEERSAEEFATHTENSPLWFKHLHASDPMKAEVTLIKTYTYTMNPYLERAMTAELPVTRVLSIKDTSGQWNTTSVIARLMRFCRESTLTRYCDCPLKRGTLEDGTMFFEFSGLQNAKTAYELLVDHAKFFTKEELGYLPDPCAGPLQSELTA